MGLSPSRRASVVEGAVVQTIEIDVDSGAAVNDLVRISTVTPEFADVATDNDDARVVVGIIIEKLTTTRASVALSGVIDDPDGTTQGIVYLSSTGRFASTPPALDYVQKLGFSFGNGKMDFKPDKTHIKLT